MVSSRNQKANVVKQPWTGLWNPFHVQQYDDQGKEKEHHHEGANLDQLCLQRDCTLRH